MRRLLISKPAERDIWHAYRWWQDNRSAEQAERWYLGIRRSISALLNQRPEQFPLAMESDLHPTGLRQSTFGLGRHPTHRIIFSLEPDAVVVVRVRHLSQAALTAEDLQ